MQAGSRAPYQEEGVLSAKRFCSEILSLGDHTLRCVQVIQTGSFREVIGKCPTEHLLPCFRGSTPQLMPWHVQWSPHLLYVSKKRLKQRRPALIPQHKSDPFLTVTTLFDK